MPNPPTHAARRSPTAATPMAFVDSVLLGYRRYGIAPERALREAGIARQQLGQAQARVTAEQFQALCGVAMRELDDEALGWFSRRLPWGSYGLLCRASLGAPDLGVALKRWCRHHALLTRDIELRLDVRHDVATLSIDERRRFGARRELCLVTSLRYIHGYACWLIDSRIDLLGTEFPFRRPAHGDVYPRLFPGPVRFDADGASMRFAAQYLALPPRRDDRALDAMLQDALSLTVLQYRRDRLLASRARTLLAAQPRHGHDATAMAQALGVSVRTLHRQLHDEGTSLQALKDAVRRERAEELLRRTTQPLKQVALGVGFASEKTFARAFRQWTGRTPREYRDSAL